MAGKRICSVRDEEGSWTVGVDVGVTVEPAEARGSPVDEEDWRFFRASCSLNIGNAAMSVSYDDGDIQQGVLQQRLLIVKL